MKQGKVFLVGAGPGDPGLITVRGLEILRQADVVVYDRLVGPALLAHCRKDAELIYVGKEPAGMKQVEINALLVSQARAGRVVCRLKGGDPFLFGRGGEEASHLADNEIPFEVVPGATSAIAVPAYAGIPVTDRRFASVVAIATGHPAQDESARSPRWRDLAGADTVVVLMGVANLRHLVTELLDAGRDPQEPAAVIEQGTTPRQRTVVAPLSSIADQAQAANIAAPAVLVIGRVVRLRRELAWAERKPLWGLRVLVTRPAAQAQALSAALREVGAEPVEFPCVETRTLPPDANALAIIGRSYDWIFFVSANGASAAIAYLRAAGRDLRALPQGKIAAVGPATAAALESFGLRVDFVPSRYTVGALAQELPGPLEGKRVLLPGRAQVNRALAEGLARRGAEFMVWPVYETVTPAPSVPLAEVIGSGVDVVTLTSPSAAQGFVDLGGREAAPDAIIACIGPPTAEAARRLGLNVAIVAEEHTTRGLVDAIMNYRQGTSR